jgi:hypothetical protein
MTTRWKKVGIRTMTGLAVATGPTIAACSSGPSYDEWAATDGAAGRINLDDVQTAFKDSKSVSDFEKRVNEIFEGDQIVLIRAEQTETALILEGWEDLNGSNEIDDTQDDKLFTVTKQEDDTYQMRGYHANSYYNSNFGAGNFLFTYMVLSSLSGPRYFYNTNPVQARTTVRGQRSSYRSSATYERQVRTNSNYYSQQKNFAGSRYDAAGKNLSTSRQGYQANSRTSGSFKSSATGVRSSWGSVGRTGFSSGGFRGGGGGQTIIGSIRDIG